MLDDVGCLLVVCVDCLSAFGGRRSSCVWMEEKKRKEDDASMDWKDVMAETGRDPEARAAQQAFYFMKSILTQ